MDTSKTQLKVNKLEDVTKETINDNNTFYHKDKHILKGGDKSNANN